MSLDATERPSVAPSGLRRSSVAKIWLKAITEVSRIEAEPRRLFADVVQERALQDPHRLALLSDDGRSLTYDELAIRISRYARFARAFRVGAGRTVGLLMPNRPEYLACWLGITSVGGTVALLNTKLVGQSLAYCIDLARMDYLVLHSDSLQAFETARPHLARLPQIWSVGGAGHGIELDEAIADAGVDPLSAAERGDVTIDKRALLIYTSGTTGLPKAANVSHRRILSWGAGMTEASTNDRLYNCLPLCHSVGGVVAPCSMLHAGGSAVIAEKFSASGFWNDVVRFDCTAFQYIGELCRYLLKAPQTEGKTHHALRLAVGNGLRADIWEKFAGRFRIPRILEFYAATEDNFSLFNVEGKVGAIGRAPSALAHRFPALIVKMNEDGEPIRGTDGLCVKCAPGEIGEAIGRIGTADHGGGAFEGYTDPVETGRNILRNVLVDGDAWVRTGDLMTKDERNFFRFVDRMGDTYRWKGENVSASEVNDVVRDCPGVLEAMTYGITVPGTDGRAGMTALVVGPQFDIDAFTAYISGRLPPYAIPVFIRFCKAIETTDTFKQKTRKLAAEGVTADERVFLRDPVTGRYQPFDRETYGCFFQAGLSL